MQEFQVGLRGKNDFLTLKNDSVEKVINSLSTIYNIDDIIVIYSQNNVFENKGNKNFVKFNILEYKQNLTNQIRRYGLE
jgi:hypothetical protein